MEAGFTLVELLVGVALGAMVLGALGGALMVSQMRVTAAIRRDLERKDSLNRAVALMRSEISRASRVAIVTTGGSRDTSDLCNPSSLKLSSPGLGDVCYKVTSSTSPIDSGYGANTDRPWKGSCLLMRQGPPYNANTGALPITNNSQLLRQVVLDDLASCSGSPLAITFNVSSSGTNATAISRDVDITITQSSGAVTSFSARTGSNPLYAGNDMGSSSLANPFCANGVCHHRLPFAAASSQNKNIFYFPSRYASYQLTNCTYAACTVASASATQTINYVDVLIFSDKEIHP